MTIKSFNPTAGATVSLAAGTSTGRVKLGGQPSAETLIQCRVYNSGTDVAFIRQGDSTVTATVTDMPIAPGEIEVFTFNLPNSTGGLYVAAITASGTPTLYFTTGVGV
jgi:hypothetical protein